MTNDAVEDTVKKEINTTQKMAEDLLKQVLSHGRRITRARNLLKGVKGKKPEAASYSDWLELARGLDGYELGVAELDEKRVELLERIEREMQKLRIKTRMVFMTKLETLAGQQKVALEKISEAPYVAYADPLTFEVNFDSGCARVLYGHELICETALDARELMQARSRALAEIKKEAVESAEFFDLLRAAYRAVLAAEGLEYGERVDLVDVLMPLAMMRLARKDWRKKGPDALKPFSRYQLAWQLSQLRRDSMLERNGARLDLGAATGGSTRDKQNVLYIPKGAGNGQYYGSIRFT
jgi:hypothetical protein